MNGRHLPPVTVLLALVALLAAGGCDATQPLGPASVVSAYKLSARDGDALPCCTYTDSAGHVKALIQGSLDVFRDGTYDWHIYWQWTEGSGTNVSGGRAFSWGTWTWNREVLVLSDSTGKGPLAASVSTSGANIEVRAQGQRYTFLKKPVPVEGQYALYTVDSALVPCCARDSAGVVVTIASAELDLGWNTPPGRYRVLLSQHYDYPDGSSGSASSTFSSGSFVWDADTETLTLDGPRLTPWDSSGAAAVSGWRKAGGLTMNTVNHQYHFYVLIQLP